MPFNDEPPDVCRYDITAFAAEAKAYALRWDSEESFLKDTTREEREFLVHLVSGAGEAVAQLIRAKEVVPNGWLELRNFRNESSHTYSTRPFQRARRLALGLLPEIAAELARGLPNIPDYNREDPNRRRYFPENDQN